MKVRNTQVQENSKRFPAPMRSQRGFSFVELIVTVAILGLVFSGLLGAFQLLTTLIGNSKAQAGATSLMSQKMEYIRSLSYNDIGTDGGVPSGAIAQNSTTTLNDIVYTERVLIQYIDDAADGIGGADTNGILADYKQVKVEYTWDVRGKIKKTALVSNIVPPGIESVVGGGTIKVNVFDATAAPLAGAGVRFVNNTTTTTIDTLRYTDLNGIAYLSAAPAAANYEITATDTGYSTDGTYKATTSNPNPITQPVAVLESQVSTMNFQIDKVSDLLIKTVGSATFGTFFDTFGSSALLASTSSTTVSAGSVILTDISGQYDPIGIAQSTSTRPTTIESWYSVAFTASTTASTTASVSLLFENSGVMVLVPDVDLPGNSSGFLNSPIDISSLDTITYQELALQLTVTSIDVNETPKLHDWTLTHIATQPAISSINLAMTGAKIIGTDALAQPIYKYDVTGVSDGNGEWSHIDIEWDIYTVAVTSGGYSVYEVCPSSPFSLSPDVSEEIIITLGGASSQLLRVTVSEVDGTPIPEALVHLTNIGVDIAQLTSLCGQTYFDSGLYDDDDYLLTVSASGFSTEVMASTTVSSSSTANVILN